MECDKMRKHRFGLIVILSMMTLVACGAKDQETFFIPTPSLLPEYEEPIEDVTKPVEEEEEPEDKEPAYVGETTTMYVRLNSPDAILNVRSLPSRDGEIVGFLVHTEQVNVIEIKDGWASFVYGTDICYVSEDYLGYKKPSVVAPPTPIPQEATERETEQEEDLENPPEI